MTVTYDATQVPGGPRTGQVQIANAASLSDEFETQGAKTVTLELPAITSAALTFQAKARPGGTLQNVYDSAGNEVTVPASTGARTVTVAALGGLWSFVIRSGTSGVPVAQGALRTIGITAVRN